jgi:hypothetical protein
MKPTKQTRYATTIVVEGGGDFPFDMLRYDCCYPELESEARAMLAERRRQVTLTRVSLNPDLPTFGRWRSFGWTVVSIDGVPV